LFGVVSNRVSLDDDDTHKYNLTIILKRDFIGEYVEGNKKRMLFYRHPFLWERTGPTTLSAALEDFGEVMSEQKRTREVPSF
jgi:hypothetical protein